MRLAKVALVVRDYDEALDFYTRARGFECLEDRPLPDGKRWLVVAPPGGLVLCVYAMVVGSFEDIQRAGRVSRPAGLLVRAESRGVLAARGWRAEDS